MAIKKFHLDNLNTPRPQKEQTETTKKQKEIKKINIHKFTRNQRATNH